MTTKRIDYQPGSGATSLGRNGIAETIACQVSAHGEFAAIEPITTRGLSQRCRVGIPAAALGDVGLACIELFLAEASPAAREDVLRRVAAAPSPRLAVDEDTGEFTPRRCR